jgi:hypothetical protein
MAISANSELWAWGDSNSPVRVMENVVYVSWYHCTGVHVIKTDGSLWYRIGSDGSLANIVKKNEKCGFCGG